MKEINTCKTLHSKHASFRRGSFLCFLSLLLLLLLRVFAFGTCTSLGCRRNNNLSILVTEHTKGETFMGGCLFVLGVRSQGILTNKIIFVFTPTISTDRVILQTSLRYFWIVVRGFNWSLMAVQGPPLQNNT